MLLPALIAAGAALAAGHAMACGEGLPSPKLMAESARYVLVWRTAPARPVVGEHFSVDLAVCPKPGANKAQGVRVDAQMPDHRHGMNYRPTVTVSGSERYRAQGMLFHMPGRWMIEFQVSDGATTDRITAELILK